MAKHTAEPWALRLSGDGLSYEIRDQDNYLMGKAFPHHVAQRIVACVNGCKGINPAAFEGLLETAISAANDMYINSVLPRTTRSLRAAIAKAEGGGDGSDSEWVKTWTEAAIDDALGTMRSNKVDGRYKEVLLEEKIVRQDAKIDSLEKQINSIASAVDGARKAGA